VRIVRSDGVKTPNAAGVKAPAAKQMTLQDRRAEFEYRFDERYAILCAGKKPTTEQEILFRKIALKEAEEADKKFSPVPKG
jgi:hypothetical protein